MKIHFDNCNLNSSTGPNTFAKRLCIELLNQGHEIADTGVYADISLVFIEKTGAPLAKKVVQRLDGIWSKPNDFHNKNKNILELYKSADAVVHQSNFDKKFIEHSWGQHKLNDVIHNGIKQNPIKEFTSAALLQLRSQYELIFVSSANWHPQKRLKSNTEMFLHLRKLTNKKCCYIVMGANPDYVISDIDVFYTNTVPENVYLEIYSAADWMLHLAWRDHCPNTNIECLSQGTPIICSADSGSAEIIENYGIILNENYINDLKPFDYDYPPQINFEQVTDLIKPSINRIPDVSIEKCAEKYLNLFKQIL